MPSTNAIHYKAPEVRAEAVKPIEIPHRDHIRHLQFIRPDAERLMDAAREKGSTARKLEEIVETIKGLDRVLARSAGIRIHAATAEQLQANGASQFAVQERWRQAEKAIYEEYPLLPFQLSDLHKKVLVIAEKVGLLNTLFTKEPEKQRVTKFKGLATSEAEEAPVTEEVRNELSGLSAI